MQEVYDQRILHSILGVNPLPTTVIHVQTDENHSPSSKRQASKVVENAWEETRQSRDYAYDESSRSRQHHRETDDREEGGRYDIGRHPPKKRRKTGRTIDDHAVFIVDDDDEEEHRRYDDDDDLEEEEGEYYGSRAKRSSYSEKPRDNRRRSYWLSKGIGPRSVDDADDDDDVAY